MSNKERVESSKHRYWTKQSSALKDEEANSYIHCEERSLRVSIYHIFLQGIIKCNVPEADECGNQAKQSSNKWQAPEYLLFGSQPWAKRHKCIRNKVRCTENEERCKKCQRYDKKFRFKFPHIYVGHYGKEKHDRIRWVLPYLMNPGGGLHYLQNSHNYEHAYTHMTV